jgi:hypothetical protein
VEHSQLLPQPVFALAQRADPSPDRGHMLTDGEVDPFHEGGVDVPTQGGQDVINGLEGAKHHAVLHGDQTPALQVVYPTAADNSDGLKTR